MSDGPHELKIRTNYWAKPIPMRQFDWAATEEDYDIGRPVGYGRTEQEAIDDLKQQLADMEDDDNQQRMDYELGQP